MTMLKGNKIKLRALELDDLEVLYKIENDPEVWEVSHTIQPFSKSILKRYIESTSDVYESKQLRLVIEGDKKEVVGLIDVFDFDLFNSRAGIGIFILENQRRKGFADESLGLLLDYLNSHLGLKQAYCNITSDNLKSIQLFESVGFIKCGEKKSWIKAGLDWKDEWMFQLIFK